jgi:hypothetical protein
MFQSGRERLKVRVKKRIDVVSTGRLPVAFYTGMRIAFQCKSWRTDAIGNP